MPKTRTFPSLFDDALQMNVSKLKLWGYLRPNQITTGATVTWSRNGEETGSISINVDTHNEQPYIELDYNFRDEPRKYKVKLVSVPSNLGIGEVWYFLCPQTKKRCRKLYSIGGYFLHREAFTGCMYDSQIQSKSYRGLDKTLGAYFRTENLYSQLHEKHFKKTYAGKPTKKYLKLMKQIKRGSTLSSQGFESLYYK
jgi:hypothetical protein